MRMILIHGINQQGKSAEKIKTEWLASMRTVHAGGPDPLGRLSRIDAAFYGDTLEKLSSVKVKDEAIALGVEETLDDFEDFALVALKEMALRMGASEAQIDAELAETAVAQGAGPHKKWVKALARVIETPIEMKIRLLPSDITNLLFF